MAQLQGVAERRHAVLPRGAHGSARCAEHLDRGEPVLLRRNEPAGKRKSSDRCPAFFMADGKSCNRPCSAQRISHWAQGRNTLRTCSPLAWKRAINRGPSFPPTNEVECDGTGRRILKEVHASRRRPAAHAYSALAPVGLAWSTCACAVRSTPITSCAIRCVEGCNPADGLQSSACNMIFLMQNWAGRVSMLRTKVVHAHYVCVKAEGPTKWTARLGA